ALRLPHRLRRPRHGVRGTNATRSRSVSPRDVVSGRLANYGADGADELRLGDGAEELLLHLTALDQEEVGDGTHAVLLRGAGIVVDVHLDDLQLPGVLARQVLHHRTDGPAGPTPGRQEADHHGLSARQYLTLEGVAKNRQPVCQGGDASRAGRAREERGWPPSRRARRRPCCPTGRPESCSPAESTPG